MFNLNKKKISLFTSVVMMAYLLFSNVPLSNAYAVETDPILSGTDSNLGIANDFNAFVFGDFLSSNTAAEGRVAAGGNVTIDNYGIGGALEASETRADLIVGGQLSATNGTIHSGNTVVYNSDNVLNYTMNNANGAEGPIVATVLDFQGAQAELASKSAIWSGYNVNGTATIEEGILNLTGTDDSMNVFNVNADDLSNGNVYGVNINVPTSSTVLINVSGSYVSMGSVSINSTVGNCNLVWNFYEASTIEVSNTTVEGSVLAPYAIVSGNATIYGTLVAASVSGSISLGYAIFLGYVYNPEAVVVEEPVIEEQTEEEVSDPVLHDVVVSLLDSDDEGAALEGASFDISKDGQVVATVTTDSEGKAYASLEAGDYTIDETVAPEGYDVMESEAFTVTDDSTDSLTLAYTNGKTASNDEVAVDEETSDEDSEYADETEADNDFIINGLGNKCYPIFIKALVENTKIDGLKGAVYQIKQGDDVVIDSTKATDLFGITKVYLPVGEYTAIETTYPDGYTPVEESIDFTVKVPVLFDGIFGNEDVIFYHSNGETEANGSVLLTKYDSFLKGVLPGAEFELYDAADNQVGGTYVTDENGEIYVDGLEPGKYTFVEVKAPKGYVTDSKKVSFLIPKLIDNTVKVVLTNREYNGKVMLLKFDENGVKLLKGAKYNLLDSEGNQVGDTLTTNLLGAIYVDGLEPGDYSFVEVEAPEGYEVNEEPVTFTLDETSDRLAVVKAYDKSSTPVEEDTTGKVMLLKFNENGTKLLSGAKYNLLDSEGNQVGDTYTTDMLGAILVKGLDAGDYSFVEVEAPEGYEVNEEPINFTIAADNHKLVIVKAYDKAITEDPVVDASGKVMLLKFNEAGTRLLRGAKYDLYDSEGNQVGDTYTTNLFGTIFVKGLEPGDYKFVEVEAPTGFLVNEEPVSFTIEEDSSKLVLVKDYDKEIPNTLEVTKYEKDTTTPLAGAQFMLFDSLGQQVGDIYTTDTNGKIVVENLASGSYSLTEVKAPTGYVLDSTPIKFTIAAGEGTHKITVYNTKSTATVTTKPTSSNNNSLLSSLKSKLPYTGSAVSPYYILGAAVILVIGGAVLLFSGRRKKSSR